MEKGFNGGWSLFCFSWIPFSPKLHYRRFSEPVDSHRKIPGMEVLRPIALNSGGSKPSTVGYNSALNLFGNLFLFLVSKYPLFHQLENFFFKRLYLI